MSRHSVPDIEPTDLRDDLAPEDRVERIWGRLEQDLAATRVRPAARAPRTAMWALAATFAAFGVGLFAGRALWHKQEALGPAPVVATNDRSTVDVFAAGTQERTYSLPGGGSITLAPGSMIELERAGGSDVRLRLLSGEASVDTAQTEQSSLAIVSGDATVDTAPGSVVNVAQRANKLDVRVASGSAQVSSPAGTHALAKGEQMEGVPTHVTLNSVMPPVVRVASARTARPIASEAPVAQIAVQPGWRELYAADKMAEAVAELKTQPGGISGAVQTAKTAGDLMVLSDIARWKNTDQAAYIAALHRVADNFGSTKYGAIAARQLGKYYEVAGQPELAKKYRDQGGQISVFGEDTLCDQMRSERDAHHKDEAFARATEYLAKYPNGSCKDEANSIKAGNAADDADSPAPTPVPSASAASTASAGVPAPSAPASKP